MVFLITLFTGSYAVSQNTMYYAFIPNGAGDIDRDGFDIGYHSIYSEWDLNGDGDISEIEFYTVMFQRLDSDKNGSLSLKEWGENYLYGQFLVNSNNDGYHSERTVRANGNSENLGISGFDSFDTNNDMKITPGEFDAGMRNTNLFPSFDNDQSGKLNRKELNKAVYESMDLDGNGIIDRYEFEAVSKLFIH